MLTPILARDVTVAFTLLGFPTWGGHRFPHPAAIIHLLLILGLASFGYRFPINGNIAF
jgi:hypothetical protein